MESIGLHNLFTTNIVRHVSSLILLRWLLAVIIQPIKQGWYERSSALVILCMRKVLAISHSWYLKACLLQVNLTKTAKARKHVLGMKTGRMNTIYFRMQFSSVNMITVITCNYVS